LKQTIKKYATNWRLILLVCILLVMVLFIHPQFWKGGVVVDGIDSQSNAFAVGMQQPDPNVKPSKFLRITDINEQTILDLASYSTIVATIKREDMVTIETTQGIYTFAAQEQLGDFTVAVVPKTNIRLGLDLQGGTRLLLKPGEGTYQIAQLIESISQRFNYYGVRDMSITSVKDLQQNEYISIELAGVNSENAKELLARQGKFEATIGNETVFQGTKNDVTHVCRTPECSGVRAYGCKVQEDKTWHCSYRFAITLSNEAAARQAAITENLTIVTDANATSYLSEKLFFYFDDEEAFNLSISSDLQGRAVNDISISGFGEGATEQEALTDALNKMSFEQMVLSTGSLPVKLEIVKVETISATLGKRFLNNALLIGLVAALIITIILFIRYREVKIAIPILITLFSELVILLGLAALIGWDLDLAAIAGIIIAIGTGVDDQIVITDEVLRRGNRAVYTPNKSLKKAFFIIMVAYLTTMVAMLPLLFTGAGIVKGFALITMLGVTVGVFITRPAYAEMLNLLYFE
jgi:preprotein translocase subunit SecD